MSHAPRGWFYGREDQPPYWDGWVWTGPFQLINEHTACAPVVSASAGDSPMACGTGLAANRCWCPGQLPISNYETGGVRY